MSSNKLIPVASLNRKYTRPPYNKRFLECFKPIY